VSVPFIDTDVIIRFLTGDDPDKQPANQAPFERIERGELVASIPHTVIADAVYVLSPSGSTIARSRKSRSC
jgi:predicted nucleic acid-binding protein